MGIQTTASHWQLKRYITSRRIFLITKRQFSELLNFRLHCSTGIKRMKSQAVVSLLAFVLLAVLLPKSDCFVGPFPGGKRELQGKVGCRCVCFFFSVVTHKSVDSPKRLVSFPLYFVYFNLLFQYRVMLGTSHLTQLCF